MENNLLKKKKKYKEVNVYPHKIDDSPKGIGESRKAEYNEAERKIEDESQRIYRVISYGNRQGIK